MGAEGKRKGHHFAFAARAKLLVETENKKELVVHLCWSYWLASPGGRDGSKVTTLASQWKPIDSLLSPDPH